MKNSVGCSERTTGCESYFVQTTGNWQCLELDLLNCIFFRTSWQKYLELDYSTSKIKYCYNLALGIYNDRTNSNFLCTSWYRCINVHLASMLIWWFSNFIGSRWACGRIVTSLSPLCVLINHVSNGQSIPQRQAKPHGRPSRQKFSPYWEGPDSKISSTKIA